MNTNGNALYDLTLYFSWQRPLLRLYLYPKKIYLRNYLSWPLLLKISPYYVDLEIPFTLSAFFFGECESCGIPNHLTSVSNVYPGAARMYTYIELRHECQHPARQPSARLGWDP